MPGMSGLDLQQNVVLTPCDVSMATSGKAAEVARSPDGAASRSGLKRCRTLVKRTGPASEESRRVSRL
jgi:hypothetical protein